MTLVPTLALPRAWETVSRRLALDPAAEPLPQAVTTGFRLRHVPMYCSPYGQDAWIRQWVGWADPCYNQARGPIVATTPLLLMTSTRRAFPHRRRSWRAISAT